MAATVIGAHCHYPMAGKTACRLEGKRELKRELQSNLEMDGVLQEPNLDYIIRDCAHIRSNPFQDMPRSGLEYAADSTKGRHAPFHSGPDYNNEEAAFLAKYFGLGEAFLSESGLNRHSKHSVLKGRAILRALLDFSKTQPIPYRLGPEGSIERESAFIFSGYEIEQRFLRDRPMPRWETCEVFEYDFCLEGQKVAETAIAVWEAGDFTWKWRESAPCPWKKVPFKEQKESCKG